MVILFRTLLILSVTAVITGGVGYIQLIPLRTATVLVDAIVSGMFLISLAVETKLSIHGLQIAKATVGTHSRGTRSTF